MLSTPPSYLTFFRKHLPLAPCISQGKGLEYRGDLKAGQVGERESMHMACSHG